jgi:hypothetical protein
MWKHFCWRANSRLISMGKTGTDKMTKGILFCDGTTTLNPMTLAIVTISLMTLGTMTLGVVTLHIIKLEKCDTQQV